MEPRQHEWRHGLALNVRVVRLDERLLDQRLDVVEAFLRRACEQ
jgi:hypothetical protein